VLRVWDHGQGFVRSMKNLMEAWIVVRSFAGASACVPSEHTVLRVRSAAWFHRALGGFLRVEI